MRSFLLCLTLLAAGCSGASASPTQSPASASATFTRSAVAGTWNFTINGGSQFVLHLAGPDEALVGASSSGGQVTGDFEGGVLRLNILSLIGGGPSSSASSSTLIDATVSADGQTATGRAVGGQNGSVTMTRG